MRMRRNENGTLPLTVLLPNIMTTLAFCCGLTGIYFAVQDKWEQAVWSVLAAAVFDGLDGRIARMLKAQSKFGAELDSLADAVSFGVAPAIINFLWCFDQWDKSRLGWVVVMAYAVCAILRLARFNAADIGAGESADWKKNFFNGMPTPAAAGLALLPLVISLGLWPGLAEYPLLIAPWLLFLAFMMVSRIPTYSFKKVHVPRNAVKLMLLGICLFIALLVVQPFITLLLLALAYVASIPMSYRKYKALAAAHAVPSADSIRAA